ncbi:MAG: STAS domain-containing protein [Solirubrobacteraceae bacterium]
MKPGELEIVHQQVGTRHQLQLIGELDLASADDLERQIATLCLEGGSEIVLDLQRLVFVDSAGLRAMLAGRQACEQGGCSLTLRNVGERIERVLDLTGMRSVLPIRQDGDPDDEPHAGQSPAEPAPPRG